MGTVVESLLWNEHTKVCITGIESRSPFLMITTLFSFAGERALSDIRLLHFKGDIKPRIK